MPTIFIENKPYTVRDGLNLLHACLELGFDLPYFCWHPAMHSVGACRQCAVKQFRDEKDNKGMIVMACMTAAKDGTRISIEDPQAREFRKSITEWMMVNHPHDCPVCDEGSECHLQDMVVMTGHTYRRYRGKKRTFYNQNLGPLVNHEMNRCIQCYRCVRFYRDFAGGRDLQAFLAHHLVYFGRHDSGVLESEFSGNLAEVCPTGVFTDKTLGAHYTRKWDLQTAPSVCVHCSIGCNTIPGERYRKVRRIRNRYNGEVNGYFLCDRGRYGYGFVNHPLRLSMPLIQGREDASVIDEKSVLERIRTLLAGRTLLGIGSPRASVEANFALKVLVGSDRFYSGVSDREFALTRMIVNILTTGPVQTPSLREITASDAVLILGEDVSNTGPMAALAIRQATRTRPLEIAHRLKIPEWDDVAVREALQDARGPLYILSVTGTRLDAIATRTVRAAPDDLARLGFGVAHSLDPDAPGIDSLSEGEQGAAGEIAAALAGAKKPLIVSGTSTRNRRVIEAAANIARALFTKNTAVRLAYLLPECNSLGLGLLEPKPLSAALEALRAGSADTAVILESDLYRKISSQAADEIIRFRPIVLDCTATDTVSKAELALPAAPFAESDGTFINYEGRAQRFYKVYEPSGLVRESWRWLRDMTVAIGNKTAETWRTLDDIIRAAASSLPALAGLPKAAPPESWRRAEMKVARQPHRYSGRTAMTANITVHEPPPPPDPDSPLTFSMEGYDGETPPALIPRFWAPGWNSIQALNKFQEEINGALRGGNPGVRLLEPGRSEKISYFTEMPEAFAPEPDHLLLVPSYHVFGSEELSALSPPVAELAPAPYLALSPADEGRIAKDGRGFVELDLGGRMHRLRVVKNDSLPEGIAAAPAGISGLDWAAGERIRIVNSE